MNALLKKSYVEVIVKLMVALSSSTENLVVLSLNGYQGVLVEGKEILDAIAKMKN